MILASLKPYYYYLIAEEKKKIEVRKTALKNLPQDIAFYMSKDEKSFAKIPKEFQEKYRKHFGKVGMKVVCDKVELFKYDYDCGVDIEYDTLLKTSIDRQDINVYSQFKNLYGWHISDLKIYDKPRELSEFKTPPCEKSEKACGNCKWLVKINTPDVYECECYVEDGRPITRPPQSYMWVKELKEV